jgi:hypothetical protein
MLLFLLEQPFFGPDLLDSPDISVCDSMMAYTIFVELLQSRAWELSALSAVEQPFLLSTGTRRAIINQGLLVATSHAIHVLPVVLAATAVDATKSQSFIRFHFLPLPSSITRPAF